MPHEHLTVPIRKMHFHFATALEVPMLVIPKHDLRVEKWIKNALVQIGLLCAAGLFVFVLLMTYGLDLSPGFF
jgi:hypothetical protein